MQAIGALLLLAAIIGVAIYGPRLIAWVLTVEAAPGTDWYATRAATWEPVDRRMVGDAVIRTWRNHRGEVREVRRGYGRISWYNTRTGMLDLHLSDLSEAEERKLEWEKAS